jgi:hypothetical protein
VRTRRSAPQWRWFVLAHVVLLLRFADLKREVDMLRRVRNSNIVNVYGCWCGEHAARATLN